MSRQLIWQKGKGFEGWICSDCGWLYPNPSFEDREKDHLRIVKEKFDAHDCAKHPRKPSN
jgi:hypothetical protein